VTGTRQPEETGWTVPWWDRLWGRAAARATAFVLLDLVVAGYAALLLWSLLVCTASGALLYRSRWGPQVTEPLWAALTGPVARTERDRLRRYLGVEVDEPQRTRPTTRRGRVFGGRAGWRTVGYLAVMLLWAPLAAGVLLALLCGGATLATVPPLLLAVGHVTPGATQTLYGLPLTGDTVAALAVPGGLMVLATPVVGRVFSTVDRLLGSGLLGPGRVERLNRRVGTLVVTRERMVEVADAERRRIERDLHDGAQQRLVALAMDLGLARRQLGDDTPPQVRQLIDEAHDEAKRAIVELRDVTRGIHPAVLTDRGLDAAMSALAARCPVPVGVDVGVEPRPPLGIELIAYYVTAEALTNVAKHARAGRVDVTVARRGDRLRVTVIDDGVGGADPARGTGLVGLVDRVAAVDGELSLSSPPGGPTVVEVDLPCGDRR
jgi:signal transduction histidine kinase